MRKLQKLALAICVTAAPAAHAGIPVIDAANLAQAITQVIAWGQQAEQMIAQLENQATDIANTTGQRGMANIHNNTQLQQVVPTNVAQLYQGINEGGDAGLTAAAQAIRAQHQVYNCETLTGSVKSVCLASMNTNAQTQANLNDALNKASQRTAQIQQLQNAIASTNDPKSIAELQARIQAEQAQVANDQNRIALMNAMSQAQTAEVARRAAEIRTKDLSKPVSLTISPFVVKN